MKTTFAVTALFITTACATSPQKRNATGFDVCTMLKAVLTASIASQDDDVHLREACINQRASHDGTIWVDARVFDKDGLSLSVPQCLITGYDISFERRQSPRPTVEAVVLVSVSADASGQYKFFAQDDNSDWTDRPPGTHSVPACGSVSGTVKQSGKQVDVYLTPHQPSDLE